MPVEIYCVVEGRVQGVGYRDYVSRYADAQGLFGWIRNRNDGSVEVVIQGTPDELKASIEMLNEGSTLARVDSLAVDWRSPEIIFDEFKVLRNT